MPLGPRLLLAAWLAWASLARADEGGIAVEVTEPCPGRGQISAALEARLPGVTGPGATRRLELERTPGGLTLRLREGGAVALERQLASEEGAASNERCEALAEAVAQVVVRYLREIGYRPPLAAPPPVVALPPPPPAPPLREPGPPSAAYLGLAGGARSGTQGPARGEALVGFQLHLHRIAGELAVGASPDAEVAVPGAAGAILRVRSYPLRLGLGVPFRPRRWMTIVPAAGVSLDLLSFRAQGLNDARDGLRLEPAAELGASYLVAGKRAFARIAFAGGLTLGARDFDAGPGQTVFRTPGAYLRAQVEVGVVLGKNDGPDELQGRGDVLDGAYPIARAAVR